MVIYFSRTGSCRKIAEKIASEMKCDIFELSDNYNWKGLIGFVRGVVHSAKDTPIDYRPLGIDINKQKTIYLVAPIWAGKLQPTMRSFIKQESLYNSQLFVAYKTKTPTETIKRNTRFLTRKEPIYININDVMDNIIL